ncbi:hypothetical protein [Burkholderia cepacia]|uniref:hypothetical protein n=1 Tax=Burkholderia cepacia TaxID=292 RepID=UPI002ABE305B|nr:hypothetical protein [Burkholderia cepacia]
MESNLIALKLFLDEVGQQPTIASQDDRMALQKVVYLGQIFGADLGYRYSWYVRGPYSPNLTQDYYALNGALAAGDQSSQSRVLNDRLRGALQQARQLLSKPPHVQLTLPYWYELLASLDFLVRVSWKSIDEAKQIVRAQKPHLAMWVDIGMNHLQQYAPAPPHLQQAPAQAH